LIRCRRVSDVLELGQCRKAGTSREREGLFGDKYVEHRDDQGRKTGTSREREGLFGDKYVEHRDDQGRKAGTSRERDGLSGDNYLETRDTAGRKTCVSRERTGLFGDKYVEHRPVGGGHLSGIKRGRISYSPKSSASRSRGGGGGGGRGGGSGGGYVILGIAILALALAFQSAIIWLGAIFVAYLGSTFAALYIEGQKRESNMQVADIYFFPHLAGAMVGSCDMGRCDHMDYGFQSPWWSEGWIRCSLRCCGRGRHSRILRHH